METKELIMFSVYLVAVTVAAIFIALHTPIGM